MWRQDPDKVAQVGAEGDTIAQIVVTLHPLAPQRAIGSRQDGFEFNRPKRLESARQKRLWLPLGGYDICCGLTLAAALGAALGQADQARVLQGFQKCPAFHRLELACGPDPLQQLTDRIGHLGASKTAEVVGYGLDEGQSVGRYRLPAKAKIRCFVCSHLVSSWFPNVL